VPTLLIAVVLLIGTGSAATYAGVIDLSTTVAEPTQFQKTDGLEINYPGQSDTVEYQITNNAPDVTYGMLVDASVSNAEVESINAGYGINVVDAEFNSNNDFNNDGDNHDVKLNVRPSADQTPVQTVVSSDPAMDTQQNNYINITGDVERKGGY
jgi:hypothetical protein